MIDLGPIANDATILGSDGVIVGTVDHVEGSRIALREADASGAGSQQRFIAGDTVGSIENGNVWLRVKAAQVVAFDQGSTAYEK